MFSQQPEFTRDLFFDIFEAINGTYLRHREISEGLLPGDMSFYEPSSGWPYVTHDDIRHGCDSMDKVHAGNSIPDQAKDASKGFSGCLL